MILTNIEAVRLDFGGPNERSIDAIGTVELEDLLHKGAFGEGSMRPKVEAATAFARSGRGRRAVICHLRDAQQGLAGTAGTQVLSDG